MNYRCAAFRIRQPEHRPVKNYLGVLTRPNYVKKSKNIWKNSCIFPYSVPICKKYQIYSLECVAHMLCTCVCRFRYSCSDQEIPQTVMEYSNMIRPFRSRNPSGIWSFLSIVREMLKRKDRNAVRLLEMLTEESIKFERVCSMYLSRGNS